MDSRAFIFVAACGAIVGVTAGWLLEHSSDKAKAGLELISASASKVKPVEARASTESRAGATGDHPSAEDKYRSEANPSTDSADVRRAKLAALRPMIESGYMFSELVSALELDAETAKRLMTLLSEHLLESRENPPFVPAGELEWREYDKPEWVLGQEEEERRKNAEIAAFFGERRYALFMDYMDSLEARRLMRELQGTLAGTPDALAEEQFLPLARAVAEGQQRYVAERGKYASPTGLEQLARYHERMREAAQPYLSPGQYGHFSEHLDQQFEAAQMRIKERMSQADAQQRDSGR